MYSLSTALIVGFGFAAAFFLIARLLRARQERAFQHRLSKLRNQYGKPWLRDRDFDAYQQFLAKQANGNTCSVDDQTWKDLDLNSVFAHLDRTLSTPGEVELHRFLRRVEASVQTLHERDLVVNFLSESDAVREQIQFKLDELGRSAHATGLLDLIWDGPLPDTRNHRWFDLLAILAVVSVSALAVPNWWYAPIFGYAFVMICGLFVFNMAVHYLARSRNGYLIHQVRYLSKLIAVAGQISRIESQVLDTRFSELRSLYERTKSIPATARSILHDRQGS